MQRRACRVFCLSVWVAVLSAVYGCSEVEPEHPEPALRSAQITLSPLEGPPVTIVVANGLTLWQLQSCFPEGGTGKQVDIPAGWEGCGEIDFHSGGRITTTVLFDDSMTYWVRLDDGQARRMRREFPVFLRDLLEAKEVLSDELLESFPALKYARSTHARGTGSGGSA